MRGAARHLRYLPIIDVCAALTGPRFADGTFHHTNPSYMDRDNLFVGEMTGIVKREVRKKKVMDSIRDDTFLVDFPWCVPQGAFAPL